MHPGSRIGRWSGAVWLVAAALMLDGGPRVEAQETTPTPTAGSSDPASPDSPTPSPAADEPENELTSDRDASMSGDPMAALAEGNRLFRDGLVAEAAEAYRAGYDPTTPHPTLVYNLGTALHHLDRLPEAILWYRRGEANADPWLEENLWLARRTLGSQILPASGITDLIARHGTWLRIAGIACAWLALGAWLVAAHRGRALALALFLVAGGLYATAVVGGRLGAEAAVLLEDCATTAGDLPAGTEVWVRRLPSGDWRIAARSEAAVCPADSVAPVALDPAS